MNTPSLIQLSLSDPKESLRRTWPLLLGLVIGLATWIVLVGLTRGSTSWLKERVGGSLPNRIRVSPATTQLGPLQLGGGLSEETVKRCQAIAGVAKVYRQAHYPGPCQLFASHQGESVRTDVILEGVDPGQVAEQLDNPALFADTQSNEIPVVIPKPVLDIINAGISAHTNLPNLSAQALIGKSFRLQVGASSFQRSQAAFEVTARIVGVSDQLGVNGPAAPLAWVQRHARTPLVYHSLTLELSPKADLAAVLAQVEQLSLSAPDLDMARRIGQASLFAQALSGLFALAILVVAGVGIASGFTVKVQLEKPDIGLYRCLGATRSDILRIYLTRAAWLGLQGSLLGIAFGLASGWLLAGAVHSVLPPSLAESLRLFQPSLISLLVALAFGPLVAIFAAWYPAASASKLEPASILRG